MGAVPVPLVVMDPMPLPVIDKLEQPQVEKKREQRTIVLLCWIYVSFILAFLAVCRLIMQDFVQSFDQQHLMTMILETLSLFKGGSYNKTNT